MKNRILITSGPSREELFDGLRLFAEKRTIDFIIEKNGQKTKLPLIIQGIEAEDGSGECWNIKFVVNYKRFIVLNPYITDFASNSINLKSKAYYSTRTREGIITEK
ncbi:MAG: hypothetical protein NTW62_03715 [Candidatus Nomurabacteria bacterium]|nr:hypothetical protein [Candidatus Nomurabacteria bacterium]